MTTTTQLAKYRRGLALEPPSNFSQSATFRERWADGVATVATVTMISITPSRTDNVL